MRLVLCGHDYKYAVEQIMLMMFPGELPEYSEELGEGLSAKVSLTLGGTYATASTRLSCGGAEYSARSRVRVSELTDDIVRDRLLQRIIKLSFYKAASEATGQKPVWGALTGIRPGKLAAGFMESGMSSRAAAGALTRVYRVSPQRAALAARTAETSLEVRRSLAPRDIALYVGIPFCPTRCAYCSFVSNSVEKSMKLVEPFLDALLLEIDGAAELCRELDLNIISVYIGGGTPTTLSAEQLRLLLGRLGERFDFGSLREFTVEAGRPDTITEEKLRALRDGGVDRVSVNPQTMSDEVLRAIGRRHTAADVFTAMEAVRRAGFRSVNMDLIAGLPLDTPEGFEKTLETVLGFQPENVTLHTLALKKGSRITLEGTPIPDGPTVSRMLDTSRELLGSGGYEPYYLYRQKYMSGGFENVGWTLPGHENIYNVCIMEELCTILALGGGGVTKLVDVKKGHIERIFNAKYPYEYIERIERSIASKNGVREFYSGGTNGI